ncbi:MAG: hypothetical protein JXR91_04975 [Deltaproteobacteria bacterium]|nr:hypothetical protein [Deltaproteobacteria bacterium]
MNLKKISVLILIAVVSFNAHPLMAQEGNGAAGPSPGENKINMSSDFNIWLTKPDIAVTYSDLKDVKRNILSAGIIETGIGLSFIASAIPLFVLDGKCSTLEKDADGTCMSYQNTSGAAVAMLSTGIALVITGVVFIVWREVYKRRMFNNYKKQSLR